jgi:hypothetical protein
MLSIWKAFASEPLSHILLYFTAVLGSLLTYLFAAAKGLDSTVPRLKQLLPGKSDLFYARLDFCLIVFLGSAVGLIFFNPQGHINALAAGCGWVGALSVLTQQKPSGFGRLVAGVETPPGGVRP